MQLLQWGYMLTLSKQSDYALIIISQLRETNNEFIPLSRLVDNTNLPQRFLARIAATLVAHRILISREGRIGGYKLSQTVHSISLLDFLKIFEPLLGFLQCEKRGYKCKFEKICKHRHGVQEKLDAVVMKQLKATKLIDLF